MTDRIVIRVDNCVRISKEGMKPSVLDALKLEFTFANPDWQMKRLMQIPGWWHEPKEVGTWSETPQSLILPRGCLRKARDVLEERDVPYRLIDARIEGAPCLKFPEYVGYKPYYYQEEAIAEILRKQNCVVRLPTGCLAGDTLIGINRASVSSTIPIADLVRGFNGKFKRGHRWNPLIETKIRMRTTDGYIRLGTIVDAYKSGKKKTFLLTTESGKKIRATLDHRFFMGDEDWMELRDIRPGMKLFVDGGVVSSSVRKSKAHYRVTNWLHAHPFAGRKGVKNENKGGWSVLTHRIVVEASLNKLSFKEYVHRLRNSVDVQGFVYLDPKVHHVHHLDEDSLNNDLSNLAIVTPVEHHVNHGRDGGWKRVTAKSVLDTVKSIDKPRMEETYDIEVREPEHNFVANDFVVHNSGKSLLALAAASRIGLHTLVILPTVGLFEQWCEDAREALKLGPDGLGIIHQKKRILRPITAAVQGTLASHGIDDEMKEYFGVVIVDECFTGETPILMADGTLKPIALIEVGEKVAVGGRVVRTMRRDYRGQFFKVGTAMTTAEHPIATSRGWVKASEVCSSDVMWYDPMHEARPLVYPVWATDAQRRETRGVCETRERAIREWTMFAVQQMCDAEAAGLSRGLGVRNEGSVESRIDYSRPEGGIVRIKAAWNEASRGVDSCEGVLHGSEESETSCSSNIGRAEGTVLSTGGESAPFQAGEEGDRPGEDASLRRSNARERRGTNDNRDDDGDVSRTGGIRLAVHREDGVRSTPLQDRSGTSRSDGGSGDRWEQSYRNAPSFGREEDHLPRVEGVVGTPLPGAVRLTVDSAKVSPGYEVTDGIEVFNLETETNVYVAGGVLVHNCQKAAARTYVQVVDPFPAKYRIGISADERRKDRKDYLTSGLFGSVAYEKSRKELEDEGYIVDVQIRVVPTDFQADWYGISKSADDEKTINFKRLIDEMTSDEKRNELALKFAFNEVRDGHQVIMLSHRVEHCQQLDRAFVQNKIASGFFIGGESHRKEFEATRAGINDKSIRVGVGTYQALGIGVNLPAIESGVATTPIGGNKFNFNQVRGRLNRRGKDKARMYWLWDRHVYPSHLKNIMAWNPSVVVYDNGRWIDAKVYTKKARRR